ncbi:MAG: hypothetical protein KGO81_03505 [Bacteroidota bacterium]|nr:hypothetical protein [Bacteroidota bacterium]
MKSFIRFIPFAALLLFLGGCSKAVVMPVNPVSGSWVLTDAVQYYGGGWQHFATGLESGVFDFYDNGAAGYNDGNIYMKGNWYSNTVVSGYYDQYGNYYNDSHQTFEVYLYDSYTNTSADIYFDDVFFTGSQMIGTVYTNGVVEKYVFSRY